MRSQHGGPAVRRPVRHGAMTRGGCTTSRHPESIFRYLPDKRTGAADTAYEKGILNSRQVQIGACRTHGAAVGDVASH
ncbi:hypothetical protein OAF19_01590, partial [bacterium]|nr:hypothetical protein [bacterium]